MLLSGLWTKGRNPNTSPIRANICLNPFFPFPFSTQFVSIAPLSVLQEQPVLVFYRVLPFGVDCVVIPEVLVYRILSRTETESVQIVTARLHKDVVPEQICGICYCYTSAMTSHSLPGTTAHK